MARLTEKSRSTSRLRREAQALVKFMPWFLLSLLFVLVAWHADIAALSGLFQSSPVETATSAPPPPNTPTPVPTNTPTNTPVAPADTTPVVTTTLTPSPTIEVTLTPTPTLTPSATPTLTPTATVTASATVEPTPTLEENGAGGQRYPQDPSDLSFEWGMLFDSVALGLSYVWLGCGILVFVTVPVAFVVLWVASRRRRPPLE